MYFFERDTETAHTYMCEGSFIFTYIHTWIIEMKREVGIESMFQLDKKLLHVIHM